MVIDQGERGAMVIDQGGKADALGKSGRPTLHTDQKKGSYLRTLSRKVQRHVALCVAARAVLGQSCNGGNPSG